MLEVHLFQRSLAGRELKKIIVSRSPVNEVVRVFQKDRVVYPPSTTVFTRRALLDRRKDESRSFTRTKMPYCKKHIHLDLQL